MKKKTNEESKSDARSDLILMFAYGWNRKWNEVRFWQNPFKTHWTVWCCETRAGTLVRFVTLHSIWSPGFSGDAHTGIKTKSSHFSGIFKPCLFIIGSSCVFAACVHVGPSHSHFSLDSWRSWVSSTRVNNPIELGFFFPSPFQTTRDLKGRRSQLSRTLILPFARQMSVQFVTWSVLQLAICLL